MRLFGFGEKKPAAPAVDKGPAFRKVFEKTGFLIDDAALSQIAFEPGVPKTYEGKVPPDNILGVTKSAGEYTMPDGRVQKYPQGALVLRREGGGQITVRVNPHTWSGE